MRVLFRILALVAAVAPLATSPARTARGADVLFVGDGSDNSVKRFHAVTGQPLDAPGHPFVSGLDGPRGLLVSGGRLLVVNQNAGSKLPGEVLLYDGHTGAPLGAVVSARDKDAPFVPRGMALGDDFTLYVGNLTTANGKSTGELVRYDVATGLLLGSTAAKGFPNTDFHPRGVVFGPDGLAYVSVRTLSKDGLGGAVLRFQPNGAFTGAFVADDGGPGRLNRPEGLAFGPDGLLYVTSFRAGPGDADSIRAYGGAGELVGRIPLSDPATQSRTYAQALLFGPNGRLFIPAITVVDPLTNELAGEVRRYDVTTGAYDVLVPAGGSLGQPWFMTFGRTDPATLCYGD